MPTWSRCLKYGVLLVTSMMLSLGFLWAFENQQVSDPTSNNTDFQFRLFFTGNVRGNIEPCG